MSKTPGVRHPWWAPRRFACWAALALALCATRPAVAAAQEDGVAQELAGIRSSLEQIVMLLRAEALRSDGAILLRRMELKTSRLVPIEQRIRQLRAGLSDVDGEQRHIAAMIEQFETDAFEAESEDERQALELQLNEGRLAFERMDQQRASTQDELARLEVESDQLLAEIDQLERELDGLEVRRGEPRRP